MGEKLVKRKSDYWVALSLCGSVLVPGTVWAQQGDATGIPTPQTASQQRAQGIPMGPITAYPSVEYGVKRDDNLFLQTTGKTADTIQTLKPAIRFEGKQAENVYSVDLGADVGSYRTSTADNYTNYNALGVADLKFGTRLGAKVRLEYLDKHDPRGSTNDPFTTTPNRYRQQYVGGVFGYGAPEAQGRFEVELGALDKQYYNNRATTVARDRTVTDIGGTFFWRIAPKTSLLFQAKNSVIDYTDPTSTLDSTERRYLAGVTWEATAATTGTVKVGQIKKDFKSATRTDTSAPGWEAQVRWSPLTYSKWDFTASKQPGESSGLGNSVLSTTNVASWTHDWNSQLSTKATGSYGTDDYQGFDRKDKISNVGLRATYQTRRWLSFGGDYAYTKRASNVGTAEYNRNVFMLFVSGTL